MELVSFCSACCNSIKFNDFVERTHDISMTGVEDEIFFVKFCYSLRLGWECQHGRYSNLCEQTLAFSAKQVLLKLRTECYSKNHKPEYLEQLLKYVKEKCVQKIFFLEIAKRLRLKKMLLRMFAVQGFKIKLCVPKKTESEGK